MIKLTDKKGFTLIEMLVVLSVIGMLIAVVLFGTGTARESTRNAQRKSDLETIRSALEIYRSDENTYPADENLLVGSGYLEAWPTDPLDTQRYVYIPGAAVAGVTSTYSICSALEGEVDSISTPCSLSNCAASSSTVSTTCNYEVNNP